MRTEMTRDEATVAPKSRRYVEPSCGIRLPVTRSGFGSFACTHDAIASSSLARLRDVAIEAVVKSGNVDASRIPRD